METHLHVVQPFQAPVIHPDRRRRERDATPFELEDKPAKAQPSNEREPAAASRAANDEGVGLTVDVEA
jgi:hypothetical protein